MYRILAITAALWATPCASQMLVRHDGEWASQWKYLVYAAPWCAKSHPSLVYNRDYQDEISWQSGQMPNNIKIKWRWPAASARPADCGAYGYNFVAYGNYDGGYTKVGIPAKQVRAISELTVSYAVDVQATAANFNGLFEFFLTNASGRTDQKAVEIGWLWHAPPKTREWAATGYKIGTFTDRYGKRWTVTANNTGVAGLYIVFIPEGGSQLTGSFDVKGGLAFLKTGKFISDQLWFNGAAMGVEPLGGSGTTVVRSLKVTMR